MRSSLKAITDVFAISRVRKQAREMRRLHREGVSGVALAAPFGNIAQNVSYTIRRPAWKRLTD